MWYGAGMETALNTARAALGTLWDSYLVRLAVLALALGAVPFYFLSLAVASLGA
jgi:hypothetical protein